MSSRCVAPATCHSAPWAVSHRAAEVVLSDSFVLFSDSFVSLSRSYVLFSDSSLVFNRSSAVFSDSVAGRRRNEVLLYYEVEYFTTVTNYYQ